MLGEGMVACVRIVLPITHSFVTRLSKVHNYKVQSDLARETARLGVIKISEVKQTDVVEKNMKGLQHHNKRWRNE
jgi:hypothetical protein